MTSPSSAPEPAATSAPGPAATSGPGPAAVPGQRPASDGAKDPDVADLWRAYELAQKHYEVDLQLFSVRMNLFLVIQSALVALAGGAALGKGQLAADRGAVASFGLALAAGWLLVASSSYLWVKTWRAHWMELGQKLEATANVTVSSMLFKTDPAKPRPRRTRHELAYGKGDRFWKQLEYFSWSIRPTLVTCCLPMLFIAGWIYLGWFS